MLPTPSPVPASTPHEPNGQNATESVFSYISSLTFQTYLTDRQILLNTNIMVKQLGTLISFLEDASLRQDQTREETRVDSPVGPRAENSVIGSLKDTIGALSIKAAVLAITVLITTLEDSWRKTVEDAVAYLVLARKQTAALIMGIPKAFESIWVGFFTAIIKGAEFLAPKIAGSLALIGDLIDLIAESKVIMPFIRAFGTIFELIGKITGSVMKLVSTVLTPIFSVVEAFAPIAKGLFLLIEKGLSKILWPLQILLSTIDFVDGFIAGYEKSGIQEGIKEGLTAVFDGLVIGLVNTLRDVVSWILGELGAKTAAKGFKDDVTRLSEDLSKSFSSLIEIFQGIAQLNGQMIWDGLKTGYDSFTKFAMETVVGFLNLGVNLVKDIFTDDKEPFDLLKSNVVDKLIGVFKSFTDWIIDWISDTLRSAVSSVAGDKIANKILGAKSVTPEDIQKRADAIAKKNAEDGLSDIDKFGAQFGDSTPPVHYAVTPKDVDAAKKQLTDEGFKMPETIKIDDQQLAKITALMKDTNRQNNVTVNNNNTSVSNRSSSGGAVTVIPVPTQQNASPANPMRRGG